MHVLAFVCGLVLVVVGGAGVVWATTQNVIHRNPETTFAQALLHPNYWVSPYDRWSGASVVSLVVGAFLVSRA